MHENPYPDAYEDGPRLSRPLPTLSLPTFSLRQEPAPPATAPQHPASQVDWQHLPVARPQVQAQPVAVNQGHLPQQPVPAYAHHLQPPTMTPHAPSYAHSPAPPQYQPAAAPAPNQYRPAVPAPVHSQYQPALQPAHAWHPAPATQAGFRPSPSAIAAARPAPRPAAVMVSGGFDTPVEEQRRQVTPLHVGILLTLVVMAMVIANGPRSGMRAAVPQSLPGPVQLPNDTVVSGGGTSTLPLKRHPQGMPSPAAAASLSVERGGRAPASNTENIRMEGIPSPAAAATLGPNTLPLKASDGMTLPRAVGERDDHAAESHYGGVSGGGGGEEAAPVLRPVATPGEAATAAQYHADMHQVDPYSYAPSAANSAF